MYQITSFAYTILIAFTNIYSNCFEIPIDNQVKNAIMKVAHLLVVEGVPEGVSH